MPRRLSGLGASFSPRLEPCFCGSVIAKLASRAFARSERLPLNVGGVNDDNGKVHIEIPGPISPKHGLRLVAPFPGGVGSEVHRTQTPGHVSGKGSEEAAKALAQAGACQRHDQRAENDDHRGLAAAGIHSALVLAINHTQP